MRPRKLTTVATVALTLGLGVPSATAQKMYLAAWGRIVRANLDGSDVEVLVAGLSAPNGIALDVAGAIIYWTDPWTEKIQRANLQIPAGETPDNRTDVEDLVTGVRSYAIALDIAGGKMYWTTSAQPRIQRANLDGSGLEDLVTTGFAIPRAIALDPAGGKMYWATWGPSVVQRANLDGSDVEDLVVQTWDCAPYSLALDIEHGKMYWMCAGVDFQLHPRIRRANLDGSGVEVLVDPAAFGEGIAIDPGAGKVYWTTAGGWIMRANLDGSGVETVLENGPSGLKGIALDLHVVGDLDRDNDVDLVDFGEFHSCCTGPAPGALPAECQLADTDRDHDIDLGDFALFQLAFTGP
jgi:sugar lactone lactonase YvrE